MGFVKDILASIWEHLRDMVAYRTRATMMDIAESSAVESFQDKLISCGEFIKNLFTFKIRFTFRTRARTRELSDYQEAKSFRETITTGSKASTQKAFDVSRKYVTLAQARALL